jgi:23S rRNA (cytosine1962-C5)-methyltransferase
MIAGTVRLTRGRHQRIRDGHPWVYRNEVASAGDMADGSLVDVVDAGGTFVGRGYYNRRSLITVRILTRVPETVDADFFRRRIEQAWALRRRIRPRESVRVVFSEADFLPGLIVDSFAGVLVFQTLTLGIDRWRDEIVAALREVLHPMGVFERNDAPVRELEGLPLHSGFVGPAFDPLVEIRENGTSLLVDVQKGQKTGHFLDQVDNRQAVAAYCHGAAVLDCFAYTGGFTLAAARAGARRVTAVEASESALDLTRANALRNGVQGSCAFTLGNVFDVLRTLERDRATFDVVILDPPAFARSRSAVAGARRGYKEINLRAMKLLPRGGILATCSCSHHLGEAEFAALLLEAAADVGRTLRLLERRGQPADHPVLLAMPETSYLKCLIFEVT